MIVFVLMVFGGIGAGCQALSNTERVTSMWVGAEIRADGSARVTEVIDYDFGHSGQTHGIYRDVPDADFDADDVRATMDGHKVPYASTYGDSYRDENGKESYAERLKVGDRNRTVGGVHRYRIQYTVTDAVVVKLDRLNGHEGRTPHATTAKSRTEPRRRCQQRPRAMPLAPPFRNRCATAGCSSPSPWPLSR
ncbi:DUF2207 domain-containing protein [Streptomyces sp. NBC_01622]|uniref:DUF2207 domain-containing protein n=1 Tax=Streptomyces sp. NBC_01622 TaxID=2975903 RepID=UPI00386F0AB0|nr:DUF2207 domain-containing protein [Streptomyces sp. NBC_01622]